MSGECGFEGLLKGELVELVASFVRFFGVRLGLIPFALFSRDDMTVQEGCVLLD